MSSQVFCFPESVRNRLAASDCDPMLASEERNLKPRLPSPRLASLLRAPFTSSDMDHKIVNREILLALWKIHILHHADEGEVVGQWMLGELREHGYDVSPGTLYPLLRRMERFGWLKSQQDRKRGPKSPRGYRLTAEGRKVLKLVLRQVQELRAEAVPKR